VFGSCIFLGRDVWVKMNYYNLKKFVSSFTSGNNEFSVSVVMTSVVIMVVCSDLVMVMLISFFQVIRVMMFFFVCGHDECCGNDCV
jgi:hypothetical protein